MPFQTFFLPFLEPFDLGARAYEELHLHLFELSHSEDELTGDDFVAECLSCLCDAERNLHAACLLHVEVVDEDTLSCLRTQIDSVGAFCQRAYLCGEHQVKLTHVSPVACSADWAHDAEVFDEFLDVGEVVFLHRAIKTVADFLDFLLPLKDAWICGDKLFLVEGITEAFGSFFNFLVDFFLNLRHVILDEDVGTITFLAVFVVDHRVVESVNVT